MQVSSHNRIATSHHTPVAARSVAGVRSFFTQPVNLVFVTVVVTIAFLGLYPSIYLLYGSLTDTPLGVPGHFTLSNYFYAYGNVETYHLVLTSFVFAFGASALSVFLALVLAWITIRTNAPCRKLFELTAIIPNIMPTLLIAISWVLLLNPNNGLINVVLTRWLGLQRGPFNIYSLPGLIFVEGTDPYAACVSYHCGCLKKHGPVVGRVRQDSGIHRFRRCGAHHFTTHATGDPGGCHPELCSGD